MLSDYEQRAFYARSRAVKILKGLDEIERLLADGIEEEAIEVGRALKKDELLPALPRRDTEEAVERWYAVASKLLPVLIKHGLVKR
jgi:hypothetical protein